MALAPQLEQTWWLCTGPLSIAHIAGKKILLPNSFGRFASKRDEEIQALNCCSYMIHIPKSSKAFPEIYKWIHHLLKDLSPPVATGSVPPPKLPAPGQTKPSAMVLLEIHGFFLVFLCV